MKRWRLVVATIAATLGLAAGLSACDTSSSSGGSSASPSGTIKAVATTNAWGSILAQLGGSKVATTSLITNPNTDPHDYEPTPADARTIAGANVFVQNGIGYDSWAQKALEANPAPGRQVITVGDVVGVSEGGNPHQWYSPNSVTAVAQAITDALKKADPGDSAYFDSQLHSFDNSGLAEYHQLINDIRAKYQGVPVGASESIVSPMAQALGLNLLTPPSFLNAISEGTDPTAADKSTIDTQISQKQIKVYLFNSQNSTPDVSAQVDLAKKEQIPVVEVTETLSPEGASFQEWQVKQLKALQAALAQSTGR